MFRQANQQLSYQRLAELTGGKPWEGTINTPGVLRLVAVGPKRIYTTAETIKIPASPKKTLIKK